jgi:Zn-dependent membrane protease YugP
MPFFGFDPTFVILIPALIFAFWAQWKVQNTYKKFSKVRAANGRTGREMALAIMARNSVTDVTVEEVGGVLSDHYDPRVKNAAVTDQL